MNEILLALFGGDTPQSPPDLHQMAARAAIVYLIGLALIRLGKSRMISRATPLDVLMGFILGSLLSRAITGNASLSGTFVASAVLVALHWLLTWLAWRSHWFGKIIKGNIELVVKDGQIRIDGMRHSHISEHDLQEQLRLRGVEDIAQVKLAHKERNGEVSVIRSQPTPQIVEVAVQAGVQTVRIEIQ